MRKLLKIFAIIVAVLVIGFQWVVYEARNQRDAAWNQETKFIRVASDNQSNLFYITNYSMLYDDNKLADFSRNECFKRRSPEKSCFIHYWVNENLVPEETPRGDDNIEGLYEYVTYNGNRPPEEYITTRRVHNHKRSKRSQVRPLE